MLTCRKCIYLIKDLLNNPSIIIMKKTIILLILICIPYFTSAHKYEHIQINTHSANSHSSHFHTHTESESESESEHNHIASEFYEGHQPHSHSHADILFLKSSGQKKANNKIHVIQNTVLDLSKFNTLIDPKIYIQTTHYSSIFISRNQPLLI